MVRLIYPESRSVSERQILSWYADQRTNEEIERRGSALGDPEGAEWDSVVSAYWNQQLASAELSEAIEYLEELGHITVARGLRREEVRDVEFE